jgi:predicted DNA-binding transcriptional regulator AlpA
MRLVSFNELGPQFGIWFCRTHLRRLMHDPRYAHIGFPKAVRLSMGRIGWRSTELEAWVRSRPEQHTLPLLEERTTLGAEPPLGKLPPPLLRRLPDYTNK